VAIAESVDQPLSRTVAYAGRGVAWLRQGHHDRAIDALERALALTREGNIPLWFPRVASALGAAYAHGERTAAGVSLLERAVERATTMRLVGGLSLLVGYLAEAYLLGGRLDDAATQAGRALTLAREHGERGNEAMVLRMLGEISRRRGNPAAAVAELDEARALSDRLAMRPLLGHCHVSLARVRVSVGDREGAARHLTMARELFAACEMRPWSERSDDQLIDRD
jgi:tetratricopeptide (TPR) repeat protein